MQMTTSWVNLDSYDDYDDPDVYSLPDLIEDDDPDELPRPEQEETDL